MRLQRGQLYLIAFQPPNEPSWTWYSGKAEYVRPDPEDHGERHYLFTIPNPRNDLERGECSFPESSIHKV